MLRVLEVRSLQDCKQHCRPLIHFFIVNAEAFIAAVRCAGSEMADYLNEDGLAVEQRACLE
jgi:hypothetical protein